MALSESHININNAANPTGHRDTPASDIIVKPDGGSLQRLGTALAAGGGSSSLTIGTTTIVGGTTLRILYDNSGLIGEYTLTGTGTVAVMQTSPALITPDLGVATATSLAIGGATIGSNALAVTGTANFGGATTIGAALTYGGVTLSNSVSGTGSMILSISPTFTGQVTAPVVKKPQTDKGTVGTGTVTFDVSVAEKQKLTVSGNLTVAFSNWPATGTYGEVEVQAVNWGSATVTLPTINWLVGDGTTSTTFSAMGVTLASSGTNHVIVWSTDGGTTLYGKAQ